MDALPVQKELGKSIFIDKPAQPVWQNNAEHRLMYSVKLYARKKDVLPPPPPKPAVVDSLEQASDTPVKKRRTFREFLKRLWKGHEEKSDFQQANQQ